MCRAASCVARVRLSAARPRPKRGGRGRSVRGVLWLGGVRTEARKLSMPRPVCEREAGPAQSRRGQTSQPGPDDKHAASAERARSRSRSQR
jgi:hypothetical protein